LEFNDIELKQKEVINSQKTEGKRQKGQKGKKAKIVTKLPHMNEVRNV